MLETHQRDADTVNPFALAKSRIDKFFAALLPATPALQFAFALTLLVAGVFVGARYLQAPAPTPAPVVDNSAKHEQEIAELKSQVKEMGSLVAASLLQQKSTSERMQTVLATLDLKSPDRKVLSDLVGALAFDPSVNVRLSAIEALTPHANDRLVSAGVRSALPRESSPLVQVAMIELLTSVRDPDAVPVFDRISRDEAADKDVRESARRALAVLRSPSPTDTLKNNNPANPIVS
jgi:hypothetical protein